jgi:hypothetical protein
MTSSRRLLPTAGQTRRMSLGAHRPMPAGRGLWLRTSLDGLASIVAHPAEVRLLRSTSSTAAPLTKVLCALGARGHNQPAARTPAAQQRGLLDALHGRRLPRRQLHHRQHADALRCPDWVDCHAVQPLARLRLDSSRPDSYNVVTADDATGQAGLGPCLRPTNGWRWHQPLRRC